MKRRAQVLADRAGTCQCGKVRYITRKAARAAARKLSRRCRAYRCGDYWHLASYQPQSRVMWYRERG